MEKRVTYLQSCSAWQHMLRITGLEVVWGEFPELRKVGKGEFTGGVNQNRDL